MKIDTAYRRLNQQNIQLHIKYAPLCIKLMRKGKKKYKFIQIQYIPVLGGGGGLRIVLFMYTPVGALTQINFKINALILFGSGKLVELCFFNFILRI